MSCVNLCILDYDITVSRQFFFFCSASNAHMIIRLIELIKSPVALWILLLLLLMKKKTSENIGEKKLELKNQIVKNVARQKAALSMQMQTKINEKIRHKKQHNNTLVDMFA